MSRSGYTDCGDEYYGLYRASVARAFAGKRGQAFLRELAAALDAMPERKLEASVLVGEDGGCCAMGAVVLARGLDASSVDAYEPREVGDLLGIARSMAAEIASENDQDFGWRRVDETPEHRWTRMRQWVGHQILGEQATRAR